MKRRRSGIWEITRTPDNSESGPSSPSSSSGELSGGTTTTDDLEILCDNILNFLRTHYLQLPQSLALPLTYDDFKLLLYSQSLYKCTIRVDIKVLFYHLLFNRVIILDTDLNIRKNLSYDPVAPLLGFVPVDCNLDHFSKNFTRALNATINWIVGWRDSSCQSSEEFYMGIERFCMFTREASLERIVGYLEEREYVRRIVGGRLKWSLPERNPVQVEIYEGVSY
jgi:hypothetical protein